MMPLPSLTPSTSARLAAMERLGCGGALLPSGDVIALGAGAVRRNVVSLFSGGGGLDLGLIRAGGHIERAYEWDDAACAAYPSITGHGGIEQADLAQFELGKLPDAEGMIGGPPCQDFSKAGRHGGSEGAKNLWPVAIEAVRIKRPAWFLFENVPGLVINHNAYFNLIIDELTQIGYRVDWRILNSADYGVPQKRLRVFIVGRLDQNVWQWPKPSHFERGAFGIPRWISWGEALAEWSKGDIKPSELPEWILKKYPREGMFETLPRNGLFPGENLRKGKNHIEIWQPAMTITNATHHCRRIMLDTKVYKLDAAGAAILQGLPNSVTDLRVIGNAVPPTMAEAIFRAAFEALPTP